MSTPMLIAADCGASRVVLARFSGDKSGSFKLEGVSVLPYDSAAESDWSTQALEAVMRGIKEFGGTAKVQLILPGSVCYGKFVKLARVEDSKLAKVVQFEAKQSIPYPLDEVAFSHVTVADDGVDLDVALAAVKLDVIEPLCRGIERTGTQASAVETSFMAEANAAKILGVEGDRGKTGVVITIGARTTNIILVEGERFFARTLNNFGGTTVSQSIADELSKQFSEADDLKLKLSRGEVEADPESLEVVAYGNAVRTFATRLAMETTRTLATQKKQTGPDSISGIYLSGGGALLQGLVEILGERFKAPLGLLDLTGNIETGPGVNADTLAAVQYQLLGLVGVAARHYQPKLKGFNLVPERVAAENRFRKQQPFLLAAAACVMGSLAFPIIGFSSKADAAGREAARLSEQVAQLDQLNRQIQNDKAEIDRVKANLAGIEDLARSRSNWLSFFAEMQERLYAVGDVWIERLVVTRPPVAGAESAQPGPGSYGGPPPGMFGGMPAGMGPPPGMFGGGMPQAPRTQTAEKANAIQLALSGRLVDRANPMSKVSKEAEDRVKRLLQNLSGSEFIVSVENERFDNSEKGILQFDFVLVVNPKRAL